MGSYALFIRRYKRWLSFEALEELHQELSQYFTQREIASGIIERLTAFDGKCMDDNGYIKNSYQDIETYFYPNEV